jgi:hypothetical protein
MCRIEGRRAVEQEQKTRAVSEMSCEVRAAADGQRVHRSGDSDGEGMGDQQIRIRISGARLGRSGHLGR